MHVPFAGTGSASAFPAPSVGKAPAFSPALRRHLFGTPPAPFRHRFGLLPPAFFPPLRHFLRHSAGIFSAPRRHLSGTVSGSFRRHFFRRSGIFSAAPQVLSQHLPPAFPGHPAGIFSGTFPGTAPASFPTLRRYPADATGVFRRLHLGLGAPQAPSSPNLPSRLLRHRRHPAEAPSRSGRTDLGSAAEGPRNQLQKRLSCSGSITSSTSPLARSISKSTPPPPVLGRPVVEISPPRGSAARRLPVWAPVEAPV